MPKLQGLALKAATPAGSGISLTCGFCRDGHHQHCPRAVANGERKIWPCACDDPDCGGGSILRCLTCKNERPGEVSPAMWQCVDPDACAVRVEKRLAANPAMQMIREITPMPTKSAAKKTASATAKPKRSREPKPCTCSAECTSTTGGTFAPGHDARLVKEQVAAVIDARGTVKAKQLAVKAIRTAGGSDALVAKFEKNLALAQARAATGQESRAAKKAAAGPKPAAKKAAAKKATSEKAAPAEVDTPSVDEDDDDF